ncbi:MAG: hypothetical protein FRX48_04051 [Lasallia pustulata]|uniref:DUF6594 domain-containing protein n=1 Tax=Lasallia pustulata TaxID=136370 RepID=A0A5M8PQV5_9LECA|nr:MAG: hypothetical protein FRX48_04051 [Lasallia pustulata]
MSSSSPVSSDQPSMGSYNKLSKFMSSWPEVAIFRRFGALNAQNLLFLQAELVRLEDQLQNIREDDAQSADLEKKLSHQSWRSLVLAHEQGDASTSQWQKVLEIRDKLKEYNAALLEYRELCKLQMPNQRSLEALREWLARPECGDYFLRGIEADVWDADEAEQADDLVSLSPTRPSIRPSDSPAIKIQPTWLAGESSDTAEQTGDEAEPFDSDSDGSTYHDSSATETSRSVPARRTEPFTETIIVFSATKEELKMRCLLDTGMRPNVINVEKAERTGLHIRKYSGRRLIAANGAKFEPVGWIKTDFYFLRRQTAKTYPVKFLVVPKEAPFDVAFGWPFISKAGLLNHNPEAFPLDWEKMDKKSTHNKKRKGEEVKEMNRRIKEEERRAEKEKRNPGGGGQSSGGGSSGGGSSGGSQSST